MVTIAADLGGTSIKLGILIEGNLLAASKIEANAAESINLNLGRISAVAREMLDQQNLEVSSVGGIGLTFPGIVDNQNARVLSQYVKYKDAYGFDFRGWAEQEWGVPLALENDARAALLGEWVKGAGKGCNNLVMLTLGTGVGSAVLLEGKLLRGVHNLAGNLGGHMSINVHGVACNCGFIGCLETEASTWAIPLKARMHPLFEESSLSRATALDFEMIFEHGSQGDALAQALVEDCLMAWGVGVVNMIHAYDPEIIIIGGGIMEKKDLILPRLQHLVKKYAWAPAADKIKVIAAEQVTFAGLLGMEYLVQELNR